MIIVFQNFVRYDMNHAKKSKYPDREIISRNIFLIKSCTAFGISHDSLEVLL